MSDLAAHYRAYLAALNERRFDDLGEFVAERLTYNGDSMTLAGYQAARRHEAETIPYLHFVATLVVADENRIAARLEFDFTPIAPFLGFDVVGRRLRFAEHVFYEFTDERITAVTSLLDVEAIRRQASAPANSA